MRPSAVRDLAVAGIAGVVLAVLGGCGTGSDPARAEVADAHWQTAPDARPVNIQRARGNRGPSVR